MKLVLAPILGLQVLAGGFAGGATALACINDRDTLAQEARGVPNVIQAVSGRFPRNPRLYYEMRLARVQQELKTTPRKFDLYDDAAVACDRLGRYDQAIQIIETKRALLPPLKNADAQTRENWYRYFANAGTFWAHRWIARGANRQQISELKRGRDMIVRAVHIKPGAHFGRERYQLKLMNWVLSPPKISPSEDAPDFLGLSRVDEYQLPESGLKKLGYGDAVEGLTGLITMGNAWQSIDVYYALFQTMRFGERNHINGLISARLNELNGQGKTSLHPKITAADIYSLEVSRFVGIDRRGSAKAYQKLRDEADAWQARRTDYMLTRLETGRHPDTDATFWNEWVETPPPSLEEPTYRDRMIRNAAGNGILFGVLGLSLWAVRRKWRRLRAA